MSVTIRLLGPEDEALLLSAPDGLFDDPVDPLATRTFIADPRHAMAVALEGGVLVGFASAFHYAHPDKRRPQLWINEVGVLESHQRRGIARRLVGLLVEEARAAGCLEAWVGTEVSNIAARRAYEAAGGTADEEAFISYVWPLDPA